MEIKDIIKSRRQQLIEQGKLDFQDQQIMQDIADYHHEMSIEYSKSIRAAATSQKEFYILMASKMKELRKNKKNLGVETAIVMMLEYEDEVIRDLYSDWIENEAKAKAAEKIIESIKSKMSLYQSLIKQEKDYVR